MNLKSLSLENFRSYAKRSFEFCANTTLLVGDNASGKTNLLEAVYLLARGESFRAQKTEEMIKFGEPLARIIGGVGDDRGQENLEVLLTPGELQGKRVAKRRFSVDGVPKRFSDFLGRLIVVLFRPEDLEIVLGSPQKRRAFLDGVLVQVDREYRRSLFSYEKALVRRNRILDTIRDEGASRTQLAFWDQLLIRHGQILTQKRAAFIEHINQFEVEIDSFRVVYDNSVVSSSRLLQYAEQEVAVGYTLVGPHKDDFEIVTSNKQQVTSHKSQETRNPEGEPIPNGVNKGQEKEVQGERNLALYGSRGEQRLAVLWLKLAELSFVTQTIGERPLLLLDDILSELDHEHRLLVLKILPHQQTIMTTTDLHLFGSTKDVEVVKLNLEIGLNY